MTEPSVELLIRQFLAERRESDGGYAPVHLEDLFLLDHIISELVEEKWGSDPDGDRPIAWEIIDRNTHRMPPFLAIPHLSHETRDEIEAHMSALFWNLEIAMSELERFRKGRNFDGSRR